MVASDKPSGYKNCITSASQMENPSYIAHIGPLPERTLKRNLFANTQQFVIICNLLFIGLTQILQMENSSYIAYFGPLQERTLKRNLFANAQQIVIICNL